MAGKGIKGITIDISGNTTGLDKALKDVDAQSKKTQAELKEVEKASKLDPTSVELYAQKQELLQDQVKTTSQRLDVLKQAQAQVEEQFKNGDIGIEQYRAFQRELTTTEASLKNYQAQIKSTEENYTSLKNANKDMQTFFDATKTSVDDFSDVLGTRLTNAIREGTASTDQINRALTLMGQKALGAGADVEKMKDSLKNINESGLQGVKNEFSKIAQEANEAGDEVNGFGDKLAGVAGALVAGGGIATAFEQALSLDTLDTQIDISMNLNEADAAEVRKGIMETSQLLGDEEAAYEGIRRQITLNKDASIDANMKIVEGARAVSFAYKEIDFKELIQETHEIGKELGISQEQALAMTNSLLAVGFPPEQLDIIAEYGSQLKMAGFSAEEVQAIMAAGVDTGTWNIDNLLDGLKEGRIVAAEFGAGVDDAMKEVLKGTEISAEQLQKWGQAVAKGGEDGSKALIEMNSALMAIEDETKRNEVGVKLYGTLWEEQGKKISETLQGMNGHLKTSAENTEELDATVAKVDDSTMAALSTAVAELKTAMAPLLTTIAEVVTEIVNWMAKNPELTATLGAVASVIGILIGAFALLMPAISSVIGLVGGGSAALGILGTVLTALTGPIGLTVAALAGLGIGIYAVSQELSESSIQVEDWSTKVSEGTAKAVGGYLDLEQQATNAMHQLAWGNATITQSIADDMIAKYDQMGQMVLQEMQTDHAAQLEEMNNFYAQSNALEEVREQEILDRMREKQLEQQAVVTEGNARIKEIWQTAANEKRGLKESEEAEIDAINQRMKESAVKHLSESERDQKLILSNLKNEATKITAEQAAEVVKNSQKEKEDVIKEAKQKYDDAVRLADMQKDELGIISQEEYDKIVGDAEKTRDETIKSAEAMHKNVVSEAKKQAKGHVDEVNWETGEVYSKMDKLKIDVGRKVREMATEHINEFKKMAKGASDAMQDAVKWVGDKVDKIKGFFTNLKLKIPKPEMPQMPEFKLKTSTKNVFGKDITFPSGLDVIWHAKGGIFDSPTLFPTAGGMHGVGEAGPEAIIPLSPKVLAGIGEGIAAQMNTSQPQVIYMQAAPIYLDGQQIAEVTFDTLGNMQYNKTNFDALSKGVNMK